MKGVLQTLGLGLGALVGIALTLVALGSWYRVDQGERGLVLRNGAFVRVAEPGLGFKMPVIESVVDISVREHKVVWEKLSSYSKDIQLATLNVAVNYQLDPSRVRDIYERFGTGYEERVLWPAVSGEAKVVFGRFTAKEAIEQRGKLQTDMEVAIRDMLKGTGLIVKSLAIQNIDFSKEFEHSIEERMKAEVEVTKIQQNWEREKIEANIVRTKAQARADATVAQAKAEAERTRLRGDAEASAIRARAEALKQNAALIELMKAEKWDGKLPTTMPPASTVPFIGVK